MRKLFVGLCSALSALAMLCAVPFPVSAVQMKIDGVLNEDAWRTAPNDIVVSKKVQSNCGVTYANVKKIVDRGSSRYYLGIMVIRDKAADGEDESGISVRTEDSEEYFIGKDGLVISDEYVNIEAVYSEMGDDSFVCEMLLGVKHGLENTVTLRFYDADHTPSNVYSDFSLEPETEPPTTVRETTERTTKEKTTKEKTTKEKTTKETTTKATTVKVTTTKAPKTTKERTTKERTTRATTVRTTKQRTTKIRTTKIKTTKPESAKAATETVPVSTAVEEAVTETQVVVLDNGAAGSDGDSVTEEGAQTARLKVKKGFGYAGAALIVVLAFGAILLGNAVRKKSKDDERS